MMSEILNRYERAQKLLTEKGFEALITASAENIQYFTGVLEPSIHTCGVAVVPKKAPCTLAVMWLDEEVAKEQAKVNVRKYTPYDEGEVIANILEKSGIAKGKIGLDGRAIVVLENALRKNLPNLSLVNAGNAIEELRWVKSDEEISLIQKACRIADKGMAAAIEALKPGTTELEVAALAENEMISLGSDEMKHRSIVASGSRTRLIHPFATHKKIVKGELIAIDLGAVYKGYCSDIARTAYIGKPTNGVKKDFETLRNAQNAAIKKIQPNAAIKDIEAAAQGAAKEGGCELIGHVGHSIGLKVEEDPHLWSARMPYPEKVDKNMTLALFQTTIQSKLCLGLRLEDTVAVTESETKLLTTYPRELSVIS